MEEKIFNKIIKEINQKEKTNLDFSFNEYKQCVNIIKDKIKYDNKIYLKNKDLFNLCEIAIAIWGLLSFSTIDYVDNDTNDKLLIVFHALSAQISNNLLSIVILCNSSLDHQMGILMRSTCELCFTLLVVMLNKDKRMKYFNAKDMQNAKNVWKEEFRLYSLNLELERYEKEIMKSEKSLINEIKKYRKEIYQYYSTYTHNTFLRCFLNTYTYSSNEPIVFNVWGEESTRADIFLKSICKLNIFTLLELFYYLINKTEIKKYIFKNNETKDMWYKAAKLYIVFKTYFFEVFND